MCIAVLKNKNGTKDGIIFVLISYQQIANTSLSFLFHGYDLRHYVDKSVMVKKEALNEEVEFLGNYFPSM